MTLLFSPNKIARALSFAALLFLLSGCASREPKNRLYLDRNWFWSLSGVEGSFSPLAAPELATLENLIPGGSGEIWLRCLFEIPGELRERELAVYLGRVTMADRTFLNGEPIGGEGSFERDAFSQWNKARLYPLPRSAFAEGERQELLVRIRADHEGSIVSSPFVGTADDAGSAALTETFWNATVNELMAAVRVEGKDQKGRMLGIEGMSEGFGAIAFNMAEGDALLLYTDCLTESRGADGSEWGPDRLAQSFSSSGDLDAASRLENILSDFSAFTGGVPLKDDLTAVIAVRRNAKRG